MGGCTGSGSRSLPLVTQQIQSLVETATQFGGGYPNRGPAHYQEIRSKFRTLQPLRGGRECSHAHQYYRHQQATSQQTQYAAKKTINQAEPGFFDRPAGDPARNSRQHQHRQKNDQESSNLSQPG